MIKVIIKFAINEGLRANFFKPCLCINSEDGFFYFSWAIACMRFRVKTWRNPDGWHFGVVTWPLPFATREGIVNIPPEWKYGGC